MHVENCNVIISHVYHSLSCLNNSILQSMSQAEKDFNMLNKELKSIKLEIEKSSGPGAENFQRKMKIFLGDAEKSRDSCEKAMEDLWKIVEQQIIGWGEKPPKRNSEPDPLSSFFTHIAKFVSLYNRAVADNKRKKEQEAKRKRQEAEKAARAAARAAKKGKAKGMSTAADDDVFGTINRKLKQGNAKDIIAEFKNRHQRSSNMKAAAGAGAGAMRNELAAVLGRRRKGSRAR